MHFAGKVWRLLVGIKDGLVLVFMLLFFALIYALLTARPSPAQVREGALLLDLNGMVVEERSRIDPLQALLSGQAPMGEFQSRDLIRALDAAAKDERIDAVVFDLDRFLGGGQVHLTEIGAAMDRVRAANKPVLTYATAYADDAMLLAAHASEVWVHPLGGAVIAGPGGERMYFAGLLDRLKVKAKVYKVGEYKSAVEPFLLEGMSDPARENAAALYGALWEEWQADFRKARPAARLDVVTRSPAEWVEASRGDLAQAAKAAGLVDQVGNRAAFDARLVKLVGKDEWSEAPGAWPATHLDAWLEDNPVERADKQIAVVTVAGEIVDGDAGPGTAGGTRIADLLDAALAEEPAGLVVRVDSPGGSVLASEEIRDAIQRHKARGIPVAVSMANLAASGGYWVATPAQRIFAQPETITGSIGIFAIIPTFEDTAAELGITTDGVRTTALSGQPDLVAGFTPEVDRILQATIEDAYRNFLERVAQSRSMTPARVDTIAQGRVWDGGTARQIGLVDQYGGLEDALEWVAGQAKLADGEWHAVYLGEEPSTYDTLLRQWLIGDEDSGQSDVVALFARREQGLLAQLSADVSRLLEVKGMQAYCLACPASGSVAAKADSQPPPNSVGWLALIARLLG